MATVTDPSFGGGFDAAVFRTAIRNTMTMGLPNTESERITFRWTVERTFTTATDEAGETYDFTASPSDTSAPDDVLVTAAVEFTARSSLGAGNAIGEFDNPRIIVTLLDTDFPDITSSDDRLADVMVVGGNEYKVDFVAPPMGLFDVTVYQVHGTAVDET